MSSSSARSPLLLSATRTHVKNRRKGGGLFVTEAFTKVVCGDDVLGGVEATVLFGGETRGTAGLQPAPVVLSRLTVGGLPKEGMKPSLSVVARYLAEGLVEVKFNNGAEVVKASRSRGRMASVGVLGQNRPEPEQKRAARGRQ